MKKPIQTYETDAITITFDPGKCIHSAVCLRGLPKVFDVNRRKWIDPTAAPADAIASLIDRCPSGALQYQRQAAATGTAPAAAAPSPPAAAVVRPSANGPLILTGAVRVESEDGELLKEASKVALCRCGGTASPPFCDGTHNRIQYRSKR